MSQRQEAVSRFVSSFLNLVGASSHWEKDHYRVSLPSGVARRLGIGTELHYTTEPACPDAGIELITDGSPLLDSMIEYARSGGSATSAICLHPKLETRLPDAIHFRNCRAHVLDVRSLYQTQVQFFFRVAFISDERLEEIFPVLVDACTEEIDKMPEDARIYDLPAGRGRHSRRGAGQGRISYREKRLYEVACGHLEAVCTEKVETVRNKVQERFLAEKARVERYYEKLKADAFEPVRKVFRQLASSTVFMDLARTPETQGKYAKRAQELKGAASRAEKRYEKEVRELDSEAATRLAELEEKYRLKVEAELISARKIMVPRSEYKVRLVGSARLEVCFFYDILRKYQIGVFCDSCDSRPNDIYLNEDGEFLCPLCWPGPKDG